MLLALETANEQCSVVLFDGQQVLAKRADDRAREQTRLILPMVDEVLAEAQLTLSQLEVIAFSRGPGSFSGVRINAAVAQGLAWANDLPVVPVSTLLASAQAAHRTYQLKHAIVVLDARMNEVYSARCQVNDTGLMVLDGEEQLLAYDALSMPTQPADWALVGNGAPLVQQYVPDMPCYQHVMANAVDIAVLGQAMWQAGQAVSADKALPVYLRDNAWKKIAEQRGQ